MAEPPVTFASLLRNLRTSARLTQEELAEAAGLSPRSISDLERGIAATPQRETIRLLADALGLTGPAGPISKRSREADPWGSASAPTRRRPCGRSLATSLRSLGGSRN